MEIQEEHLSDTEYQAQQIHVEFSPHWHTTKSKTSEERLTFKSCESLVPVVATQCNPTSAEPRRDCKSHAC